LIYSNLAALNYSEQNLVDCVSIGDNMVGFPSVGLSYYLNNGLMNSSSYPNNWSNSVNIYICFIYKNRFILIIERKLYSKPKWLSRH
jgi:hypothetical protein